MLALFVCGFLPLPRPKKKIHRLTISLTADCILATGRHECEQSFASI